MRMNHSLGWYIAADRTDWDGMAGCLAIFLCVCAFTECTMALLLWWFHIQT